MGFNDDDLFRLLLYFDGVIRVSIVALDQRTIGLENNLADPMGRESGTGQGRTGKVET